MLFIYLTIEEPYNVTRVTFGVIACRMFPFASKLILYLRRVNTCNRVY